MTVYGERAYRRARAELAAGAVACVHRLEGCTGRATTPDHVPAIAEHAHTAGGDCCVLVPSCASCNLKRGAALGNRRRRASSSARLRPGSGVI